MSDWQAFKIILTGDLEAWDHFVSQISSALEKEKDLNARKQLQATLAPLLVYQEVTKHYLEVMDQIEDGTYQSEEVDDGGNSEKLN